MVLILVNICISGLELKSQQMIVSGYRCSTQRTYNSVQNSYIKFCHDCGLIAVPADERTILLYLAHLSSTVSGHSVNVYLAAVKSLHVLHGIPEPPVDTPRVKLAIRSMILKSKPPNRKLPITYDVMCQLYMLKTSCFDSSMFWAAMTLAFFGCLRAGEITVASGVKETEFILRVCDVHFGVEKTVGPYMSVTIRRTKRRPHGIKLNIGCTKKPVCAYCAMVSYMKSKGIVNTSLSQAPLFVTCNGLVMDKDMFVTHVRQKLQALGYNCMLYSGHSFRSGSATTAAQNKFKDFELKYLGHWASDAYQRYVHIPLSHEIQYAHRLAMNE